MKGWFKILKIDGDTKAAKMKIFGSIGADVDSAVFAAETDYMCEQGINTFDIDINSAGGSVFSGNQICNTINAMKAKGCTVNGYVTGMAASMASRILMACTKAYMYPNAQLMIHEPSVSLEDASIAEMQSSVKMAEGLRDGMAEAYALKSKLPKSKILQMMAATTWLTAKEALKKGFIDEIMPDNYKADAADAEITAVNKSLINSYINKPDMEEQEP